MPTHVISTSRYVLANQSIITAGKYLQNVLDEDFSTLDYAIAQLDEAASNQDKGAKSYRAFMFTALESTKPAEKAKRGRVTEDVFSTIMTDLQVGSVLVAAGEAVGETGEEAKGPGRVLLNQALDDLETITPVITRGLSSPIAAAGGHGRFNFLSAAEGAKPQLIKSPDDASAIDTFRTTSELTMHTFVGGFREVVVQVGEALIEPLKKINMLDLLEKLGEPLKAIGGAIGRLIKKGIKKIRSAIDALVALIGNESLRKIRDHIKNLWNETGQKSLDGWTRELLAKFMGVEATRKIVKDLPTDPLRKEAVDEASNELSRLVQPFKNDMEMSKKMVSTISLAATILFILPVAGQKVALFAAIFYLLVLSHALLVSMDYCDSGAILRRVRGVGEIANSLRAS